jgi:hypothetical protein
MGEVCVEGVWISGELGLVHDIPVLRNLKSGPRHCVDMGCI